MPETIAHFQLLEPMGRGTLGELHRARDLELGRTVALRLVGPAFAADPGACRAVLSRARLVSSLLHPAVAAVYECGEDAGQVYVASEFVPGQRLAAMVSGSPLHPRRALDLAAQIADGLAAAHALELLHGALSSAAVIVTPKGAAKILDVGMCDWTGATGQMRLDDGVGLGAVLFEMLVGRPLKHGWPGELRLSQIPAEAKPVLQALTSSREGERYESMATAAAALRELAEAFEARR